jgi:hypothetical protein
MFTTHAGKALQGAIECFRCHCGFTILPMVLGTIVLSMTGLCDQAFAQSSEQQKQWSGTWVMTEETTNERYLVCCDGPAKELPLTPKYRKIRDDFAAIPFNTTEKTVGNLPHCISPGTPGLMQHPLLFEFLWSPGRVNMIFQDGSYRRFYTDGRKFPESLTATFQGYSVGHWEGDTLVVETRGIATRSELLLSAPINTTRRTKVTERFTVKLGKFKTRLVESDRVLKVRTTIEDPELLLSPYTFDMDFVQVPIVFETGCAANNRDNGNEFDLTPPEEE